MNRTAGDKAAVKCGRVNNKIFPVKRLPQSVGSL